MKRACQSHTGETSFPRRNLLHLHYDPSLGSFQANDSEGVTSRISQSVNHREDLEILKINIRWLFYRIAIGVMFGPEFLPFLLGIDSEKLNFLRFLQPALGTHFYGRKSEMQGCPRLGDLGTERYPSRKQEQ